GRGRSQFMNGNLVFNSTTALTVPYSTLGVGVVVIPSPNIVITSSVFNTEDSSTTTGFGDIGDGWTWATEATFQYRLGGLPGGQVVGLIYAADGDYLDFNRTRLRPPLGLLVGRQDDTWAFTWSGWQYLHTPDDVPDRIDTGDGRADLRGFGLFARVGFADDDTNPIDLAISGGIGGRGIFPGRADDTFGVGLVYTKIDAGTFLSRLGIDDDAYGLEAYYDFDLGRGLWLTADLQVIEAFSPRVDTTTILGLRLNVRF
ncbi:MAG: carbohydrate porin, partial [Planctomycetota bacterium]